MPEIENRRLRGKLLLGTSLVTCPEKRSPNFHYPLHYLCLEDRVWEIFHNQMRSEIPERCSTVMLMCVEFTNGVKRCHVEENRFFHAEVNALQYLDTFKLNFRKIYMYISRSPCIQCLPIIENFIYKNRNTIETFQIRFSSVHAHYNSQAMERLQKLDADIGVFNDDDWNHLEKHLTYEAYYRLTQKFEKMSGDQSEEATNELEENNNETDNYDDDGNNENDQDDGNGIRYEIKEVSKDDVFTAVDSRISEDDGCDDIYTKHIRKIQPINNYFQRRL